MNPDKITKHTNKFTAIFSDNDPYVDAELNSKVFKEKLNAKIVIVHNQGHMTDKDLPVAKDELLKMIS